MTRWRRFFSRIGLRILAFNLLLLFLPLAGVLYVDVYEEHLVEAQRQSMYERARLIAEIIDRNGLPASTIENLELRNDERIRIVSGDGTVIADSAPNGGDSYPYHYEEIRSDLLYRIGTLLLRKPLQWFRGPEPVSLEGDEYEVAAVLDGIEIENALAGRSGSAKRIARAESSPSVILYEARPVHLADGRGAVLVSRTTHAILHDLYAVRLGIFRIFLGSVLAAIVLSMWIGATIVRPLGRLQRESEAILDRRGRLKGGFTASVKRDEIGDLSRALERLTSRLETHQDFSEHFAADVSHEFRNPLASIRNAVEMMASTSDPHERDRFLSMANDEINRMENLLGSLREITRIDARLDNEPLHPTDVTAVVRSVADGFRVRGASIPIVIEAAESRPLEARASEERLVQVFENVLENALSFTPAGGSVTVSIKRDGEMIRTAVRDSGPGIPEGNLSRVFDRFFSWRDSSNGYHAGLGLAIVKAIVEGYGGRVTLQNHPDGGAELVALLPAA